METRAHHVLIGLFTVLGVAAALIFALWLGQPSSDRDYQYYMIGFTRAVSGLSVGSRVEYSGIRVGEVVDLRLNPEDPRRVRALIRVFADTPVNVDTTADLALANISGAMKIQLRGGTPSSPRIAGDADDPPLIVAEPSSIGAVLETGEDMLTSLGQLLSEENIENISQTLENLQQTTSGIAAQGEDISAALSEFSSLSAEANQALSDISQLARDTNAALNAEEQGLLSQAKDTVAALDSASQRLDQLLENNEGALNDGMRGLGDLGPAMGELRRTLGNLNRITRRLEDNPRGFLFSGEEIQEFEP